MPRAKERDTRALTERDRKQRLDEMRELERSERSDRVGGKRNWKRWSTERQWLEQPWRCEQSFPRFQSKENISRPLAATISLSSSPRGRTPSSDCSSRSGCPPHCFRSRSPIRVRSRSLPRLRRGSPSHSSSCVRHGTDDLFNTLGHISQRGSSCTTWTTTIFSPVVGSIDQGIDVMWRLFNHGADANGRSHYGSTLLHKAADNTQIKGV